MATPKKSPPVPIEPPVAIGPVTAEATASVAVVMVFASVIQPSPTNPRKHFDPDRLQELAASIAKDGVLQPLLVRPVGIGPTYELVAGERRWRAAKLAGLERLPVIVRKLDDVEVLELQVVENLQRADLHPLEEADGYRQLHETHGHDVDAIAAKVGKSRGYVYGRMKLLALPEAARELFFEGGLTPSVALLVARIPVPELAEQAARCLAGRPTKQDWDSVDWVPGLEFPNDPHGGRPATHREAVEWIEEHFTLRMDQAPFSLDDAELVPEAGACAACPKRTANEPALFADLQRSADACTDPPCFRRKREAHAARVVAEHEAKGVTVLVGKESEKALRCSSGWLETSSHAGEVGQYGKTWKRLLGKKAMPETVVAIDGRGEVHEIARKQDLVQAAKTKGVAVRSQASSSGNAAQKAQRALAKKRNGAIRLLLETLIDALDGNEDRFVDLLRLVVARLAECVGNDCARLVHQVRRPDHQPKKGSFPRWSDLLKKELDGLEDADVLGLAVQLAAADLVGNWSTGMPEAPKRVATALGLDLKALERQAAPPKKRKRAAKKKGGKKRTAKKTTTPGGDDA